MSFPSTASKPNAHLESLITAKGVRDASLSKNLDCVATTSDSGESGSSELAFPTDDRR